MFSDFTSKDKIRNAIRQVLPQSEHQPSPVPNSLGGTSELLHQKKVRLLKNEDKNTRNMDIHTSKPIFQLDGEVERSSEVNSRFKGIVSEAGSSRVGGSLKELSKYKKPLPSIGGR